MFRAILIRYFNFQSLFIQLNVGTIIVYFLNSYKQHYRHDLLNDEVLTTKIST